MKASEMREKSVDDLKAELLALLKEKFNLRIQKGAGQLAKPSMLQSVKVAIARVKTVLKEKGVSV
jgi:large subunit ribosomal protein L29